MADLIGHAVESAEEFFDAGPGVWMVMENEEWGKTLLVRPPCGHHFVLAHPPQQPHHEVEFHLDGTVTIEPREGNSNSILCRCGWHGYISRGRWYEI